MSNDLSNFQRTVEEIFPDLEAPKQSAQDEMLTSLQDFQRRYAIAEVFCPEKPEKLLGAPIGQYHCPYCGLMVLAGLPHPGAVLYEDGTIDYDWIRKGEYPLTTSKGKNEDRN